MDRVGDGERTIVLNDEDLAGPSEPSRPVGSLSSLDLSSERIALRDLDQISRRDRGLKLSDACSLLALRLRSCL